MSDGYDIHYRLWGPEGGSDVLVVLHGGMSHSAWQRPLADAVRARSTFSVFAPDRRGCGLNGGRGDLASADRSIEDVVEHLRMLAGRFERIHLAGWCQGGQYAAVAAQRLQDEGALATLLLITPGLFWNARFRSVIDMTERVVQNAAHPLRPGPGPRRVLRAPIPLQATDFTQTPDGLDFIDADALKTTEVTLKSVIVMDEVQERSWEAILGVRLPVFAMTATADRIVDNQKVRAYLAPLLGSPGNRIDGDRRRDTRCSSSGRTSWPVACSNSFVEAAHPRSQHLREIAPDLGPIRWIAQAVEAGLTQHQHPRVVADGDDGRRPGRIEHDRDLAEHLAFAQHRRPHVRRSPPGLRPRSTKPMEWPPSPRLSTTSPGRHLISMALRSSSARPASRQSPGQRRVHVVRFVVGIEGHAGIDRTFAGLERPKPDHRVLRQRAFDPSELRRVGRSDLAQVLGIVVDDHHRNPEPAARALVHTAQRPKTQAQVAPHTAPARRTAGRPGCSPASASVGRVAETTPGTRRSCGTPAESPSA